MTNQNDFVIDNGTGFAVRQDIQDALQALAGLSSGNSEPSVKYPYQLWADTNANILKIRNSGNTAWINLFTLAGGVDVDAASNFAAAVTFTDDVTFDGANAGRDIVFDRSQNALEFLDNAVAKFGTDADASFFHDGSDLHVINTTGMLKIKGNDIHLQREDGTENCLTTAANGAVGAFFDNELKLTTVTGGIQVHNIANNAGILLSGTGNNTSLIFTSTADSPDNGYRLSFHSVSATRHSDEYLAIDKTDTAGTGGIETITTFTVGGQHFDDNKIIHLGGTLATGDLQLYHDGSAGRIHSASHPLYLRVGGQFGVFKGDGSESKILAEDDGQVKLFFDNEIKLETLTDGAQCRGVMHVLSQDGNVSKHTEALYYVVATNSSTTLTLTGMVGSGRFVLGGYANAGQGALALNIFLGGAMFATQHYNVNELQTVGMQNISVSTSKNNTSYVVTITNSSSSYGLSVSGFIESTGSQITVTAS